MNAIQQSTGLQQIRAAALYLAAQEGAEYASRVEATYGVAAPSLWAGVSCKQEAAAKAAELARQWATA